MARLSIPSRELVGDSCISRIAIFGDGEGVRWFRQRKCGFLVRVRLGDVVSLAEGVGFGEMGVIGVCRLVRFAGNLLYCDNF